ncbi:MAG: hypothetical protein ACLT09_07055 [Flavonifractor plautii]
MYLDQALQKIEQGLKACGTDRRVRVMARPVSEALKDFCRQSGEFAQAVVQGGDFPACMAAVAKGAGDALSDLEAYRRAVSFYFPGAMVDMHLSIRMSEYELSNGATDAELDGEHGHPAGILLSLADFL